MLDSQNSQKYPGANTADLAAATPSLTPTVTPLPDAPGGSAVASASPGAAEEYLVVSGAAWAEYHLLLGDSPAHATLSAQSCATRHATRIEREIRSFGGAPTIAVLLARWGQENPQTAHLRIKLSLNLGRDPNARLLRRELESWAARLPNLRLQLRDDSSAPEVAYRILMWPPAASTCSGPAQVLQCGDINWRYEIGNVREIAGISGDEAVGDEVGQAALFWALANGTSHQQKVSVAALDCWSSKPVLERIACNLSWREIEAAAEAKTQAEAPTRAETEALENI